MSKIRKILPMGTRSFSKTSPISDNQKEMEYRYLGNSGLSVSVFSFGNWLNSNNEENYNLTKDAIKKCHDAGINFFDTAESYGFWCG
jgi:hypothetical protein